MRRASVRHIGIALSFILVLTACGSEQSSGSSQQFSYKEMKTMVVDILKSEEGKKAVEEAISSSSGTSSGGTGTSGLISMQSIPQANEQIRVAVKDTITSPEYKKEIEKVMTDPKFAGDFAKAISSQSKQLHLQLIKDPTYQKSVQEIMKSPEMMKMFLDLTKTADYRKQTATVMQETMQNPLFRMEVLSLLKSVVQEELQPKVEKKESGSGSSGESGGEESGGGEEKSSSGS